MERRIMMMKKKLQNKMVKLEKDKNLRRMMKKMMMMKMKSR
jgi:hypothetical protein